MLILKTTSQFKIDNKRMKKQGKNMDLLRGVIDDLLAEKTLDVKHHDHSLSGNYTGFRECHILPDWLLVYAIDHGNIILTASRTGTHSDLFAHGLISFSEAGSQVTVSDLEDLANSVKKFLDQLMQDVALYIRDRKYMEQLG